MSREPIAIVGLGCRLPGGVTGPADLWRLLQDGVDAVREVPPDRWDADRWTSDAPEPGRAITRFGGFLDDVASFDADLFGIAPREALQLDPQQRLLLEAAWEALERAGMAPDRAPPRTGTYVGMGISDYGRRTFLGDPAKMDAWSGTGTFTSVAAGRIAYALGLRGPALAVHTACSSSLVALHLAVRALRGGEVDVALAGGVNLLLSPEPTVYFSQLQALSADGRCRTFDASANGYGRGEGCALLALMRLSDAMEGGHPVLAVIRGSAINQDGRSNGLTAPSGRAQQEVLRAALDDAGLHPQDIGAIEAHGTGTPLGDPIEMEALSAVFGGNPHRTWVGSIKTNLGHLEAAAGVAGVLKAALSVRQGAIPPHLHLQALNPRIRLDNTALAVPTALHPLEGPRRIGVSAFGLAGTNAHLIVEAPPPSAPRPTRPGPRLLVLSGASPQAVEEQRARWSAALDRSELPDLAHTAAVGRAALSHRIAVVAESAPEAQEKLAAALPRKRRKAEPVVFAFTGQGAQRVGMALDLLDRERVFAEAFRQVDQLLAARRGRSLVEVIGTDDVHHTAWTQPALFAVQWGLAALWRSWGIEPEAVVGHSVGEVAAACLAGVLTLEDAATLVEARGRCIGELPAGGAMVAVRAGPSEVEELLGPELSLAAVNAPDEVVLSGSEAAVDAVLAHFAAREPRKLTVSHAFHSHLMEPALGPFLEAIEGIALSEPQLPWITAAGEPAETQVTDPAWWARQIREPVRFREAVRLLQEDGLDLFLELGPAPILSGLGPRCAPETRWIPSLRRDGDSQRALLEAAGALWADGQPVALEALARGALVDAPTYAFQRQTFWIPAEPGPTRSDVDHIYRSRWVPAPAAPVQARAWEVQGDEAVAALLEGGEPSEDAHVLVVAGGSARETLTRVQRLLRDGRRVSVLTCRGVSVGSEAPDPEQAALWGFAAVAALEHLNTWGAIVDVHGPLDRALLEGALSHPAGRVAVRDGKLLVERLIPARPKPRPVALQGTWLITGGSGALGTAVAQRLAQRGIRHLVLLSRSGKRSPALDPFVEQGVRIDVHAVDVTDEDALKALIAPLQLGGVVHCAGTTAWEAKAEGARALDALVGPVPFVIFGSIAGVWGSAGLATYAAANRFAEAIAERRRARGWPGLALSWGPWAAGGIVAADELERFARMGVTPLQTEEALDRLELLLGTEQARWTVARVDWDRLRPVLEARRPLDLVSELGSPPPAAKAVDDLTVSLRVSGPRAARDTLERLVREQLAAVLGLGQDQPLDPERGFFDLGLDSLMAVELADRLRARLGLPITATVAFDHPSLALLVAHLLDELGLVEPVAAPSAERGPSDEPIAIVGLSCRFPGAPDPEAFWRLLENGLDAVGPVPPERWDAAAWTHADARTPIATDQGGFLSGIDRFDAAFFGMGPDEAAALDPQQRLLLEVSWEALERSGIAPRSLKGSKTGVFVGIGRSEYWRRLQDPTAPTVADAWAWSGTGNETSFAAGRLAWMLGLRGPALGVNTACSSSLVALHLACRALARGECDRALAGGVNVILEPEGSAWLTRIGALSPTGRCHTFDAAADGYVRSEGCGVVVLRRLSDALASGDRVLAVIRGTAVAHDGATSGLTVPSGSSQQEVLRKALQAARLSPSDLDLVECHGTGTALGDPIEVGALRALHTDRDRPLLLGAVKTQIGHLEAAAGIAGVIKTALALHHGRVPGNLHQRQINPALPLDFPVEIPASTRPWPADGHRIAGVSSFGISGTNAHVILSAPEAAPAPAAPPAEEPVLLLVSGHTPAALQATRAALREHLADLPGLASTLLHARSPERHRLALLLRDGEDARAQLAEPEAGLRGEVDPARRPKVAFLITGQGAQTAGMGLRLREVDPVFREALDRCVDLLYGQFPLLDVLADEARLHQTRYTQPALFAVAWALAERWRAWGVVPEAVVGHSVGEYVAACISGALTLEEALELVAERGRLMGDLPTGGGMLAVRAGEAQVLPLLGDGAEIAAVNSPDETVLSGDLDALERIGARLEAAGVQAWLLHVSHAFHSRRMEPILGEFERLVRPLGDRQPRLTLVSDLDGAPLQTVSPDFWVRHLREPVRFADAVRGLAALGVDTFLELGPRPVLSAMAARTVDGTFIPSLRPGQDERDSLLTALGTAWAHGVSVDPSGILPRRIVPAPTTAWDRERHWIEAGHERPAVALPLEQVRWEPLGEMLLDVDGPIALLGEHAALSEALVAAGHTLADALEDAAHVIAVPRRPGPLVDATRSALQLTRRWVQEILALPHRPTLTLLTRQGVAVAVDGTEEVDPANAALHGLIGVLALEHPDLRCAIVDVDDGRPETWLHALRPRADRVAVRAGRAHIARKVAWEPGPPVSLPREQAILVTGGLGALGRRVARWLVEQGCRSVHLLGRRPPTEAVQAELADLPGVQTHVCDVTDRSALSDVLQAIGPVGGVIHCAGVPHARWLRELEPSELDEALAAKVLGGWHLHELLGDVPLFVLFGSATAWYGLPGQGAYAAANAFLDGLAAHRRAQGLAAVSIAWGPWQAGMADQRDWQAEGVRPLDDARALQILGHALRGAPATLLAIDLEPRLFRARYPGRVPSLLGEEPQAQPEDEAPLVRRLRQAAPARRRALLTEFLQGELTRLLARDEVSEDQGFFDAGLDSLMAVELARKVGRALGRTLPATLAFDHPSLRALTHHLLAQLGHTDADPAKSPTSTSSSDEPIAIVGLGLRFPGANDPQAFWDLLCRRAVAVGEVPPDRWDAEPWSDDPATRFGAFVDEIERFDPDFFGVAPREAASLDPQQRLLLEVAWTALEDAGHAADRALRESRTGVFVGITDRGYLRRFQGSGPFYPDAWAGTGTEPSFAPGRVAHLLNLRGPAIALNTTCSSALVAVHLACQSLRAGECDRALAGGVSLLLDPEDTAYLASMNALSPTGRCHTFSADADGYVRGEGCGMFVLTRLSDALARGDRVLAVIRGSAINHDGQASGLTVPNGAAQEAVLRAALEDAGVRPEEVEVIEAHGTGTPLGDPIEVRALRNVYPGPLVLGAVKANVGHLELAAGAAGLAKVVLALQHEAVPPQPELGALNPELPLDGVTIPTAVHPWPRGKRPRRAAVSAFGLSGTNAHLILEEGVPRPAPAPKAALERPVHLLAASVHAPELLPAWVAGLRSAAGPLPDLAHTVHTTRRELPWRAAAVASDRAGALEQLAARRPVAARPRPPQVAFLFTGQGAQYAGMGLELYASEPVFREALDTCARLLAPHLDRPLLEVLADERALGHTRYTQPALFAMSWALGALWRSWGVEPAAVLGHSVGELAAACFAGVLSLGDGLALIAARGELMGALPTGGGMAALFADEPTVRALLVGDAEIAGLNAPSETVIAGSASDVERTVAAAAEQGVEGRTLDVSHAFHSARLDPMLGAWERTVAGVTLSTPEIPLVSALTGEVAGDEITTAAFWRRHAREPVRFADALRQARALGVDTFIELGPHPVLCGMGQRTLEDADLTWLPAQRRGAPAQEELLRALGRFWERGGRVDWEAFDKPWPRQRVSLPPTPLQRRRFWLEGDRYASSWTYALRWEEAALGAACPPTLALRVPENPEIQRFSEALTAALQARGVVIGDEGALVDLRPLAGEALLDVLETARTESRPLFVVSRQGVSVGTERVHPTAAPLWGLLRVLYLERPELRGGHIDLDKLDPDGLADALTVGEDAVAVRGGALRVPRLVPCRLQRAEPELGGTWLITGGLGALGRKLASWLAERGVTRLILTGRRPLPEAPTTPEEQARIEAVEALRARGVEVIPAAVDVTDESAMLALLEGERLSGVVHAAGVTAPQALPAVDPDTFRDTLRAKVDGAWVLDRFTRAHPVEHFVLYGSIAGVWGSRELAAYAAANAALDGLAHSRRAEGLPGLCLDWGPWADGGMVDDARAERLARMGQRLLSPERALRILGDALASDEAQVVVASVQWPRFLELYELTGPRALMDRVRGAVAGSAPVGRVEPVAVSEVVAPSTPLTAAQIRERVLEQARAVLRLDASRTLPLEQPLMELGFDSLMATELKNALLADGLDVPLGRLLGGPSVEEIAIMVEARQAAAEPPPPAAPTDLPDAPPPADDLPSWMIWSHLAAALVGAGVLGGLWQLLARFVFPEAP